METVCTFVGLTSAFAVELVGTTRSMLFSSRGVVIMKMISSTNARSSSGVTFSSLTVWRALRSENLRMPVPC